jgi:dihydroorotate dehydrogenase (fumarate)
MIDLSTQFLGRNLKNPLVVSSSPLTESVDNLRRLEDAGAAAVVLPSLFEEQLSLESEALDRDLWRGTDEFPEATTYFPDLQTYNMGPGGYLDLIRRAKKALTIPVIASLNGSTPGGWIRYAREMEQAGADAIELNLYSVETEEDRGAQQVEEGYCELVRSVKSNVHIPVIVKLSPFFSAMVHMAKRLDKVKADGLVLFNRFYQPDFDIDTLEVVPRLYLSQPNELLLRLHWTAVIYGHVRANLAITGGVHTAEDVLKSVMAGANVAMMASALLENGAGHLTRVLRELSRWMQEHEYESIQQMIGSMSHRAAPNPSALERGNYMRVLSSYTLRPRIWHS